MFLGEECAENRGSTVHGLAVHHPGLKHLAGRRPRRTGDTDGSWAPRGGASVRRGEADFGIKAPVSFNRNDVILRAHTSLPIHPLRCSIATSIWRSGGETSQHGKQNQLGSHLSSGWFLRWR